jgi:hypothetical protein
VIAAERIISLFPRGFLEIRNSDYITVLFAIFSAMIFDASNPSNARLRLQENITISLFSHILTSNQYLFVVSESVTTNER